MKVILDTQKQVQDEEEEVVKENGAVALVFFCHTLKSTARVNYEAALASVSALCTKQKGKATDAR